MTEGDWSADPQQAELDPRLLDWMRAIRDEIRKAFAERAWPSVSTLSVVFDSAARVEEQGFSYFK